MKNKAKKKQKGKNHTVTIQSHFGFNMDPNKQLIPKRVTSHISNSEGQDKYNISRVGCFAEDPPPPPLNQPKYKDMKI